MLGLTAVAAFDTDHRLGIYVHGRTGAVLAHPGFGNDARDSESFGLAALPVRYSLTFPQSSLSLLAPTIVPLHSVCADVRDHLTLEHGDATFLVRKR